MLQTIKDVSCQTLKFTDHILLLARNPFVSLVVSKEEGRGRCSQF